MDRAQSASSFVGRVQVYTGNGKGKTTAAMGLALRAAGHGYRTYIGQFCKGRRTGEIAAVGKFAPLIKIEQFGDVHFLYKEEPPAASDLARARKGLSRCRAAMLSNEYRIVVLDEICLALYFKLLTRTEVETFLKARTADVELVLTGRKAPAWLLRRADLVTEMREVKHYYAAGVGARRGIED